jgi:extradiol dioxygenase family protein
LAVNMGWPCWVGVVADDLDVQRRFYRDVLGLAELAAGPGWVQFDFNTWLTWQYDLPVKPNGLLF